nr:PEGA domain-containing protein [Rhodothermaceae bacterium]
NPTTTPPPVQSVTPAPTNETRTIQIYSTPSGATVRMNGRTRGTTPLTLDNIQPELQRFQVSLEGYETANVQLDVSQRQVLRTELTPLTGQIRVVVRPFGDIFVDGVQKATATSRVYQDELTVGTHKILARHPALGVWEKNVTINAGQEADINFNFAQEYTVTVVSQPTNIYPQIVVDGVPLMTSRGPRTTPAQLSLPPGNHSITVQLEGFKVVNGPIDIVLEDDNSAPVSFTLEPE